MTDCILWTPRRNGQVAAHRYGRVWDPERRRSMGAHVLAWEAANGAVPDGAVVRHKCDNPPCVNPHHLEIGTMGDNSRDMVKRGRARGQFRAGDNTTLSAADVLVIRSEWTGERGQAAELGRRFGVHRSTVLRIAKGDRRAVAVVDDLLGDEPIDKQRNACAAAVVYAAQGGGAWDAW